LLREFIAQHILRRGEPSGGSFAWLLGAKVVGISFDQDLDVWAIGAPVASLTLDKNGKRITVRSRLNGLGLSVTKQETMEVGPAITQDKTTQGTI